MSLALDVRLARPGFHLNAAIRCGDGVTALFGRSGAGKTTLAALLAGLVRPDAGRIILDGRVLFDHALRIDLPPHRRAVGTVFQDGRLLPHLSVRQNLAYPGWFRRGRGADPGPIIDLLGLGALLDRRPAGLSGGERQRVALGRALLARPQLLILDEPLAALDQARKTEILRYLGRLKTELALNMIYVSHSLDEIIEIADEIVLLDRGQVVTVGPVGQILAGLAPEYGTAGVIIAAEVEQIDQGHDLARLRFAGGILAMPAAGLSLGAKLRLRIHARDVAIATEAPRGLSILNILPGRIMALHPAEGAAVLVELDIGGSRILARVTRLSVETLNLAIGQAVHALIKGIAFEGK